MSSPLDILRRSFALYRANGQLIVGYAAWLLLTAAAFVLTSFIGNEYARESVLFAVQVADLLLWMWVGVLVMRLTADVHAGRAPDAAALPREAWTLVAPFVWVSVLQGIVVLGGTLLLIVPGVIFMVWFAFAPQALIVGGKRGLEALSESRALCRGRFFTAAWYEFVGPFLVMLAYLLFLGLTFAAIAAITRTPAEALLGDRPPLWMDMTASVGEIFLMPVLYIYWTLVYLELKTNAYVGTGDRT